jgi:hypothetical protein
MSPFKLIFGPLAFSLIWLTFFGWAGDENSDAVTTGNSAVVGESVFIPLSSRGSGTLIPLSGRNPTAIQVAPVVKSRGPVWSSPVSRPAAPLDATQSSQNRFWAPPEEFSRNSRVVGPSSDHSGQNSSAWSAHPPTEDAWLSGGATSKMADKNDARFDYSEEDSQFPGSAGYSPRMADENDERFNYSESEDQSYFGGADYSPRMADENDERFNYSESESLPGNGLAYEDPVEYRRNSRQSSRYSTRSGNLLQGGDRLGYGEVGRDFSNSPSVWNGEASTLQPRSKRSGRSDYGRSDLGRSDYGISDYGRSDFSRPDSGYSERELYTPNHSYDRLQNYKNSYNTLEAPPIGTYGNQWR